ncbi:(Fe-S)-binding protein [Zavarzinia sp. CC-PAN008]|uniref:(Fe-S)-binding protein n=1 Tax=Zavarzinia sp. CC-PAN008 TaxID=3243332 RepID=UPI003F748AC0
MSASSGKRVGLLVTCLVDLFRPSVGFAAVRLMEQAGCTVEVPEQTCCGQPAYNSGDRQSAAAIARQVIDAFAPYDYLVAPSGSCAGMVFRHYPGLFPDDAGYAAKARALARKSFELTAFLVDVLKVELKTAGVAAQPVAYHDSCSSRRDLGVVAQPRALLAQLGVTVSEVATAETCCGFGGAFCVKYPAISGEMARKKCDAVTATGAPVLLGNDLGCLLHLGGTLSRQGSGVEVRHIAEVLAGPTAPAIGKARP